MASATRPVDLAGAEATLSVCCLTDGRAPDRLAAILALLRPLANEVVVAVERAQSGAVAFACEGIADDVVAFPRGDPADRAIPWLFAQCSSQWIFNVDDDEVPSRQLLSELPKLLADSRITHAWIARRWLYPTTSRFLDEAPWRPDYQLRLVRRDPRFLQFSDEFHRPVVATGPAAFVEAPLWHLDCLLQPYEQRRTKALAYERARRGMRVAGIGHNTGFYLPELNPLARTAQLPDAEREWIERVSTTESGGEPAARTTIRDASEAELDRQWPGEPYDRSLYAARLELRDDIRSLIAGVQRTVDVLVENRGRHWWRWGKEAQPEIRLSYRWTRADGVPVGDEGLRTPLPCDIPPGGAELVPVHVVGPAKSGHYRLAIDLIHEHVRWFGCAVDCDVHVGSQPRIAVAGQRRPVEHALDSIALVAGWEALVLAPDSDPPAERFGLQRISGFRSYLLGGLEDASRPVMLIRLISRSMRLLLAARALRRSPRPRAVPPSVTETLRELGACERLLIAGPDWQPGAAPLRELWRLTATAAAAKSLGVEVLLLGDVPVCRGLGGRLLARTLRAHSRPLADAAELVSVLA